MVNGLEAEWGRIEILVATSGTFQKPLGSKHLDIIQCHWLVHTLEGLTSRKCVMVAFATTHLRGERWVYAHVCV